MLEKRAKCIVLRVQVESGSGELETGSRRQAVLRVSIRC